MDTFFQILPKQLAAKVKKWLQNLDVVKTVHAKALRNCEKNLSDGWKLAKLAVQN